MSTKPNKIFKIILYIILCAIIVIVIIASVSETEWVIKFMKDHSPKIDAFLVFLGTVGLSLTIFYVNELETHYKDEVQQKESEISSLTNKIKAIEKEFSTIDNARQNLEQDTKRYTEKVDNLNKDIYTYAMDIYKFLSDLKSHSFVDDNLKSEIEIIETKTRKQIKP